MRTRSKLFGPLDETLVFILLALMLIGFGAIFTSQFEPSNWSLFDLSKSYGKQLLWIGISLSLFLFIQLTDSRLIISLSYFIYGIMIFLLMIVFVKGQSVGGNQNWINFGFFKLQPSEFVKFGTALALAKYLSRPLMKLYKLKDRLFILAIVGLPLGLILLQGDVGSALVYLGFVFVLNRVGLPNVLIYLGIYLLVISVMALLVNEYILMGGLVLVSLVIIFLNRKSKQLVSFVAIVGIVSCIYVIGVELIFNNVLKDYHRERIEVMLGKVSDNAGASYNLNQSKIAIGSGGIFGKGYLNGTQTRYDFVPELSTDFIFCTIGEELGFLGSILIIGLFVGLILRIIFLAERQCSHFNQLFMYGVASIIFMHFLINIGMTIGLAPVIGIPLPFISMEFHAVGFRDLQNGVLQADDNPELTNLGRGGFTENEEEYYQFKVPQLYNLKNQSFYGHGGSFNTLEEVVLYFNKARKQNNTVPEEQISEHFTPLNLTSFEIEAITEFLEHGLYDNNLNRYYPDELPSGNCFPNADVVSKVELGCQ